MLCFSCRSSFVPLGDFGVEIVIVESERWFSSWRWFFGILVKIGVYFLDGFLASEAVMVLFND